MANDLTKLSSPRIFLIRMLVFLILCGLIAFVLQHQIFNAFLANPWLNGLIIGVLAVAVLYLAVNAACVGHDALIIWAAEINALARSSKAARCASSSCIAC